MKDVLLLVMRHAKSDWSIDGQKDFDRVLNARGLEAAPKMGDFIKQKNYVPQSVISSSAMRAKTTAQIAIRAAAGNESMISYNEDLYYGTSSSYLAAIQTFDLAETTIGMVVGHNPLVEQFISLLANNSLIMPTAGIACIQFSLENSWKEITPHSGQLKWFISPKL
jgi:phosphohistidine phosphatase